MPLPIFFIGIGIAAATGLPGVKMGVKAGVDTVNAKKINRSANELLEDATDLLNRQRTACGTSLEKLGEEKIFILSHGVKEFLDTFTKIKNVDFHETEGLDELKNLHIDAKEFEELKDMSNLALSVAGGTAVGTAGGALAALGAYSAASSFAAASTGTAIASLSGAAASNATLAFFGGGSIASGGLGMAGGTVVLGGIVAGPALLVMGAFAGKAAEKKLDQAYENQAEAEKVAAELDAGSLQCASIRRRTYVIYNLLARLDSYVMPLVYQMEDIVKAEGDDYRDYKSESKKVIAQAASVAGSIKAVLDTPLLNEAGELTEASAKIVENIKERGVLQ